MLNLFFFLWFHIPEGTSTFKAYSRFFGLVFWNPFMTTPFTNVAYSGEFPHYASLMLSLCYMLLLSFQTSYKFLRDLFKKYHKAVKQHNKSKLIIQFRCADG